MPRVLCSHLSAQLLAFVLVASTSCTRSVDPAPGPRSAPTTETAAQRGAASANVQVGSGAGGAPAAKPSQAAARDYRKPSDEELRTKLTPLEYKVTQEAATEPPFANRYFDNHEEGLYVDVASGEPLFSSRDKFDSGTGWPSFSRPIDPDHVQTRSDGTLGMQRTEVRSRGAGSHLGHVFEDGPAPTGLRYCINSAALRFVPVSRLAEEGYADYLPLFGAGPTKHGAPEETPGPATANSCTTPPPGEKPGCAPTLETAILAGGCFWGMEEILRKIPGVVSTEVGYAGGKAGVTYEDVHTGKTGNAEAVRVVFDPKELSYEDLLEKWFFRMHDPTTPNRQGNDVGSQYRSAIFVTSPAQRDAARRVEARVDASHEWKAPVVTQIVDAGAFTRAEEYHQHYLERIPEGYTCHYLRDFPTQE
jgi:peptide methionine sulfoxide reductase msrA/msrB